MRQLIFIMISVLVFGYACKKEKRPSLPSETQIGANTIGFKLNGEIYRVTGRLSHNSLLGFGGVRFKGPSVEAVFDGKEKFRSIYLDIYSQTPVNVGEYTNFKFNDISPIPNSNSYVKVTRYDEKVYSGTFQFDIISYGEVFHITEGRFDISSD